MNLRRYINGYHDYDPLQLLCTLLKPTPNPTLRTDHKSRLNRVE